MCASLELRIADCGLNCGLIARIDQSAINPQSAIRNPQYHLFPWRL
jgi:hypothetical protein